MAHRHVLAALLLATAVAGAGDALARRPTVPLPDAIKTATQVYRSSHGLMSVGEGLTQNVGFLRSRQIVADLAEGARAKYGLEIRIVSPNARIPGLTAYPGPNPAKWDPKKNIIFLRAGMPAKKLLREVGHEYGAFLLAKRFGGKSRIPRIGEGRRWLTHVLDDVVATDGKLGAK